MVPDVLDDQPFCIWNPDIAHENTYRELARRHPAMRYQVGRACAAAGYASLYRRPAGNPSLHTNGIDAKDEFALGASIRGTDGVWLGHI